MPALTLLTYTYKRPLALSRCKQSVCAQTCQDVQHLIIEDSIGLGVGGMYADLPKHVCEISGDWVYYLQDDDRLAHEEVVSDFTAYLQKLDSVPDVVIVRNEKGGHIFPVRWYAAPEMGFIDLGNFIVRRDVFTANANFFGHRYEGDYDFIRTLWDRGYKFEWYDRVFSICQISRGMPE